MMKKITLRRLFKSYISEEHKIRVGCEKQTFHINNMTIKITVSELC